MTAAGGGGIASCGMAGRGIAGGRRLWLVRHGETEGQSSIRYHGRNDVPLSDLGRSQIRALAPLFAGIEPVTVLHSPLQRAAESAHLLAAAHHWPLPALAVDARLQEISFGDCEGMTAAEIEAAFPEFWAERQRGTADAFPGGESRRAFAERVAAAVAERAVGASDGAAGDVVVVAHRGTVRQALRQLLGLEHEQPDPRPQFAVRLGSLSVARRPQPADIGAIERWQVELLDFVP